MTPEQMGRVFIRTVGAARREGTLDEKRSLWAMRVHFEQLREDRGNKLPRWDWPHERRPRMKQ